MTWRRARSSRSANLDQDSSMDNPAEHIHLSPDDAPDLFYRKLLHLPPHKLAEEITRFQKYAKYWKILHFQQATFRQPALNIRMTYNRRYGWHISTCIKSAPEQNVKGKVCTCETDITTPTFFLYRIDVESRRVSKDRCKLCKVYDPRFPKVLEREM